MIILVIFPFVRAAARTGKKEKYRKVIIMITTRIIRILAVWRVRVPKRIYIVYSVYT